MSRAFLVAGSRAVVVSLWSVASKETEELMVAFYQHLRQGIPAPVALRRAKLQLMGMESGSDAVTGRTIQITPDNEINISPAPPAPTYHPYYWAPFILVGT